MVCIQSTVANLKLRKNGESFKRISKVLKANLFEMSFLHRGKSKSCTFLLFGQILCKGVVKGVNHWVTLIEV
jgi:hypothetical protein